MPDFSKPQPITIATSQIKRVNGFGWWADQPDKLLVNANIEGYEDMLWYEMPAVLARATREANEQQVGLSDIADQWNERLRKEEDARLEASGIPHFTWTWDNMSAADFKHFQDVVTGTKADE